jgi:hypothetical protein
MAPASCSITEPELTVRVIKPATFTAFVFVSVPLNVAEWVKSSVPLLTSVPSIVRTPPVPA